VEKNVLAVTPHRREKAELQLRSVLTHWCGARMRLKTWWKVFIVWVS